MQDRTPGYGKQVLNGIYNSVSGTLSLINPFQWPTIFSNLKFAFRHPLVVGQAFYGRFCERPLEVLTELGTGYVTGEAIGKLATMAKSAGSAANTITQTPSILNLPPLSEMEAVMSKITQIEAAATFASPTVKIGDLSLSTGFVKKSLKSAIKLAKMRKIHKVSGTASRVAKALGKAAEETEKKSNMLKNIVTTAAVAKTPVVEYRIPPGYFSMPNQQDRAEVIRQLWNDISYQELSQHIVLTHAMHHDVAPNAPKLLEEYCKLGLHESKDTHAKCRFFIEHYITKDGVVANHLDYKGMRYSKFVKRPHSHWSWNQLVQPHVVSSWETAKIAIFEPINKFKFGDFMTLSPYDTIYGNPHKLSDEAIVLVPNAILEFTKSHLPNCRVVEYQENGDPNQLRQVVASALEKFYPKMADLVDDIGNKIARTVLKNNITYGTGCLPKVLLRKKDGATIPVLMGKNTILCSALKEVKEAGKVIGLHVDLPTFDLESEQKDNPFAKYFQQLATFFGGDKWAHEVVLKDEDHYFSANIDDIFGSNLGILAALSYYDRMKSIHPQNAKYLISLAICVDMASIFYKKFPKGKFDFSNAEVSKAIDPILNTAVNLLSAIRSYREDKSKEKCIPLFEKYRSLLYDRMMECVQQRTTLKDKQATMFADQKYKPKEDRRCYNFKINPNNSLHIVYAKLYQDKTIPKGFNITSVEGFCSSILKNSEKIVLDQEKKQTLGDAIRHSLDLFFKSGGASRLCGYRGDEFSPEICQLLINEKHEYDKDSKSYFDNRGMKLYFHLMQNSDRVSEHVLHAISHVFKLRFVICLQKEDSSEQTLFKVIGKKHPDVINISWGAKNIAKLPTKSLS